jgi:hypothetical protein
MGGFLSSIFTGNSPGLSTATNNLNSLAGYTGKTGETNTNAASNYNLGILSGDPTQVAQTLSPEIKAAQDQAQQNKNTVAQFGNRGGGMNSVMAGLDDATRGKLISLMGSLRQGAAGQLGQLGTAETGQATQQNLGAGQLSQMQLQNMLNSILGKGISSGVGAAEGAGLGALGL